MVNHFKIFNKIIIIFTLTFLSQGLLLSHGSKEEFLNECKTFYCPELEHEHQEENENKNKSKKDEMPLSLINKIL